MKAHDLTVFKKQLQQMAEALNALENMAGEAAATVELDQTRTGRLTRMDALQGQQMAKQAGRRRQQQLRLIELALANIKIDDYGYCAECGENIALPRLQIDPSCQLCIDCAERMDE